MRPLILLFLALAGCPPPVLDDKSTDDSADDSADDSGTDSGSASTLSG